jgi:hypothetical protein
MLSGSELPTIPTETFAFCQVLSGMDLNVSTGFDTIQATYDGDIHHLTELRLWAAGILLYRTRSQYAHAPFWDPRLDSILEWLERSSILRDIQPASPTRVLRTSSPLPA